MCKMMYTFNRKGWDWTYCTIQHLNNNHYDALRIYTAGQKKHLTAACEVTPSPTHFKVHEQIQPLSGVSN